MASASTQQALPSLTDSEPNRRRLLEDLGLVMLVGFAPLIVSAVYLLFAPFQFNPSFVKHRFSGGLAQEFAVLILFVSLLRRQGRGLKSVGLEWKWTDLPKAFGLFVLSYFGSSLLFAAAEIAYHAWKHSYFHFRDTSTLFAGVPILLMLVYGIAAACFEETLVWGYLMTELIATSCPAWLAAGASVAIQVSYHLYYGVGGALFVGFGFIVSAVYFARSRRLTPVILSHMLWDLTATYWQWHR